MIKILTACGTGINSSHQIKDAIEQEMRNRGHDVACDAVIINNITKEMMDSYDIFAQIAKPTSDLPRRPQWSTPAPFFTVFPCSLTPFMMKSSASSPQTA